MKHVGRVDAGKEEVAIGTDILRRIYVESDADNNGLTPSLRMSESVAEKTPVLNKKLKKLKKLFTSPSLRVKAEALQSSEEMLQDVKALFSEIDDGINNAYIENLLEDASDAIEDFLAELPKLKKVFELGADVMEDPYDEDAPGNIHF